MRLVADIVILFHQMFEQVPVNFGIFAVAVLGGLNDKFTGGKTSRVMFKKILSFFFGMLYFGNKSHTNHFKSPAGYEATGGAIKGLGVDKI